MSKETLTWLNTNVLVGMTDQRGHAWHYRASAQGSEPNHYPDAIPVDDVVRRLFSWEAVELPVFVRVPTTLDDKHMSGIDGDGLPYRAVQLDDRKAIARSDTHRVMGLFKSGYHPHQYRPWLLDNVETILNGGTGLAISSAGLLKGGAVAWVEVSVPESRSINGLDYRPNLVACTSFDGSLATTYKRTITATVCDNTLSMALSEKGQTFKAKHTRNSGWRIADAREALAIVADLANEFEDRAQRLMSWKISDVQFREVLKATTPITNDMSKNAITIAENKWAELGKLYRYDPRCAPWKGTAFGVFQAYNTYAHHVQTVRGVSRPERNMLNALDGTTEKADAEILRVLASVAG